MMMARMADLLMRLRFFLLLRRCADGRLGFRTPATEGKGLGGSPAEITALGAVVFGLC